MKDKIAEILKEFYPAVYFMMDERTEERFGEYIDRVEEYNKAILDLIARELPKEKEEWTVCPTFPDNTDEEIKNAGFFLMSGYNRALKDTKHKLGVE